jgi:hypothetical protein
MRGELVDFDRNARKSDYLGLVLGGARLQRSQVFHKGASVNFITVEPLAQTFFDLDFR